MCPREVKRALRLWNPGGVGGDPTAGPPSRHSAAHHFQRVHNGHYDAHHGAGPDEDDATETEYETQTEAEDNGVRFPWGR